MPDEKIKIIADNADMVVGGYAFTKKDGKIAVLNINNPEYAMVLSLLHLALHYRMYARSCKR